MSIVCGYFDASGSASGTDVVAVAGLVSAPDRWLGFERDWNVCLADHGVSALHMKDFTQSKKDFLGWDLDEHKRRRFLNQLLWVVEDWIDWTTACAVDIPLYDSMDREYAISDVMRPYSMASFTCIVNIWEWMRTKDLSRQEITYFFEKGDEDQDDLRRCWKHLAPRMIVDPIFLNKTDSLSPGEVRRPVRPFEAADFIAYENFKANLSIKRGGGSVCFNELRKPLQRMKQLPGAEKWATHDERDSLEKLCISWKIPLRPVTPAPA